MYEILHGENVVFAKRLLNDAVVGQRDALFVDLTVSALVDQLAHGLQVGLAIERVIQDKKDNKR